MFPMNTLLIFVIFFALAAFLWFLVEKSRRKIHPVTGGLQKTKIVEHTDTVELYSNSFSHCSRKARLVLGELSIPYKHHHIELIETGWYQTISADYLKVNPAGLVPTLVHTGHPVYESDDILNYAQTIAANDAPQLVPSDPELQAKMQEWLDFCAIVSADILGGREKRAGACIPGMSFPMFIACIAHVPFRKILPGFLFHFTIKSPFMFGTFRVMGLKSMMKIKPLRELMIESREHMANHLATINQVLEDQNSSWILGDDYSLADISIGCMLLRLDEAGWLRAFSKSANLVTLNQYFDRIKARPAWQEAIDAYAHPVVEQATQDLKDVEITDPELFEMIYGIPSDAQSTKKDVLSW